MLLEHSISQLIVTAGYLVGITLFMIGLYSLFKRAQDPQRYTVSYAALNIIAGSALLISIPMIDIVGNSLAPGLGEQTRTAMGDMPQAGDGFLGTVLPDHIWKLIVSFLFFVGLYAFVKGLYLIRSIADGGETARPTRILTHLLGGVICMNPSFGIGVFEQLIKVGA